MSRIGFVTCARWPALSESDAVAARALEARGIAVVPVPWNGPDPRPAALGALVLRANWDYHFTPEAFVAWLDGVERAGPPVWNTVVLDTSDALVSVLRERGWRSAVVKPLISASAHDTVRVESADVAAMVEALTTGSRRTPAIVQPFVEEITTSGEWSLVFVEGELTHAVLKRPAPGEFRVQPGLGGTAELRKAPAAVAAAGGRVLAALPERPLYARIDGVERAGEFTVMEVEVNEPDLFLLASRRRRSSAGGRRARRHGIDSSSPQPPSGDGVARAGPRSELRRQASQRGAAGDRPAGPLGAARPPA
ncbi:MAG TPA: hypothetical protein VFV05_16885 [Methylomirabilota bacterium]|nr:hypothetical protein [Methylomirabilota bacterium]